MKKFDFSRFCTFMAVAIAGATLVACGDDDENAPAQSGQKPTVTLTAGVAAENAVTFTVTTTNAEEVAYICVDAEGAATVDNTADAILKNGTKLEAKASQSVTVENLEAETLYYILAAVANEEGSVVSQTLEMTTTESTAVAEVKLWLSENTLEAGSDGTTKQFLVYVEGTDVAPTAVSDNPTKFIPMLYADTPATDENYPDAIVYTLHVDATPNRVEQEQTGNITVTVGALTATIECRQEAYTAPLQQAGAVTIVFGSKFPSETVVFDSTGTSYEWDGFKLTFYNNSGKFSWMYGLSGSIRMGNGDAVKIDGMGTKKMSKVEWISTDFNFLNCGLKAGDVALTTSEFVENNRQYYVLTWEGSVVDTVEFVTAFNEEINADSSVAPAMVRVSYAE